MEEAKTEAEVAYQALQRLPLPPLDREEARHPLRAYARVMEGRGDDAGAVKLGRGVHPLREPGRPPRGMPRLPRGLRQQWPPGPRLVP